MKREAVYVVVLVLASLGLGRLIWFLPPLLLLTGIIAYTVNSPLCYLGLIALGAELISVLPPGVVTLAVLTPWLARRIGRRIDIDVSLSYLLLIILTVVGQRLILFMPDSLVVLSQQSWSPAGWSQVGDIVPWWQAAVMVVFTSLFIYGATVLLHFNRSW